MRPRDTLAYFAVATGMGVRHLAADWAVSDTRRLAHPESFRRCTTGNSGDREANLRRREQEGSIVVDDG